MSNIKERLLGAITVMDEDTAWELWEMLTDLYREENMETPNEETLQAMQEVEEMIQNPSMGKRYHDVDEMLEELLA